MQQFRVSEPTGIVLVKTGTRIAKWGWPWEKFKTVIEQLLESAQVWMVNGPGEEAAASNRYCQHAEKTATSSSAQRKRACAFDAGSAMFYFVTIPASCTLPRQSINRFV